MMLGHYIIRVFGLKSYKCGKPFTNVLQDMYMWQNIDQSLEYPECSYKMSYIKCGKYCNRQFMKWLVLNCACSDMM